MDNYNNIDLVINLKQLILKLTMPYTEAIMYSVVFLICCAGVFILARAIAPHGFYDSRNKRKATKNKPRI
jgi:hypothetical protein